MIGNTIGFVFGRVARHLYFYVYVALYAGERKGRHLASRLCRR